MKEDSNKSKVKDGIILYLLIASQVITLIMIVVRGIIDAKK